jgi:hypothetical protein
MDDADMAFRVENGTLDENAGFLLMEMDKQNLRCPEGAKGKTQKSGKIQHGVTSTSPILAFMRRIYTSWKQRGPFLSGTQPSWPFPPTP